MDIFDLSYFCTALSSREKPPSFRKLISCTSLLWSHCRSPIGLDLGVFNFQIPCDTIKSISAKWNPALPWRATNELGSTYVVYVFFTT